MCCQRAAFQICQRGLDHSNLKDFKEGIDALPDEDDCPEAPSKQQKIAGPGPQQLSKAHLELREEVLREMEDIDDWLMS